MIKFKSMRKQSGISLIEIMVAMVLGLFLAAGFFEIMNSSKQTYKAQSALAWLQADARFALQTIDEHLRLAGARSSSISNRVDAFRNITLAAPDDAPVQLTFGAAQFVTGIDDNSNNQDNVLDGTDVIAIRYQQRPNVITRNCLGNIVDANTNAVDIYYINNNFELRCRSGNQDQPLVNGVENLQILYGMASNYTPGNPQVSCYLDASTLGSGLGCSGLDFNQVVSVRYGLLLHTAGEDGKRLRTDDDTSTYSLPGAEVQVNDQTDHRLRRVFSTTVSLRNRLR